MSNPTELPDLEAEKANFESWAGVKYRNVDAYTNLDHDRGWQAWRERARRAKPEGEAPQAEPAMWVQYIDGVKTQNVARDDKEKATVESIHRTMAPGTKMAWRALYDHAPAATLSPLCGAQHAESGKEDDAAEKAAAYDELNRIAELHGFESAAAAIAAARRVTQQATPAPRIIGGKPWSKEAEMTEGWLAAQQAAAPTWGAVHTVGDMVRNLLTLDQAAPIFTAFHVTIDGERRCHTRGVTISKERVIDGTWIDSARKDVPYTHIIWAKPDERAPSAPGTQEAPKGYQIVPINLPEQLVDELASATYDLDDTAREIVREDWERALGRLRADQHEGGQEGSAT